MPAVLLIADEPELTAPFSAALTQAGYAIARVPADDAISKAIDQTDPDLVLICLPGSGAPGLDRLGAIRRKTAAPIILLLAEANETGWQAALALGGDDVICGPLTAPDLIARVRALLYRSQLGGSPEQGRILVRGRLTIDLDRHLVFLAGNLVPLTPPVFNLLAALASHPGWVFNRRQIIEAAQGVYPKAWDDAAAEALILELADTLDADPDQPAMIERVHEMGYRFAPQVLNHNHQPS